MARAAAAPIRTPPVEGCPCHCCRAEKCTCAEFPEGPEQCACEFCEAAREQKEK